MVSRTISRKFGTFLLDTTNGINVEKWDSQLMRRARYKQAVRANASIRTQDAYDGHMVSLKGQVFGTDTGVIDANLSGLLAAVTSGEDDLQLFDDRELRCALDGKVTYKLVKQTAGLVYQIQMKFRSRFPTWRATAQSSSVETKSGVGPFTLMPGAAGGDAGSFPVIRIENTGTSFTDRFITLTNTASLHQFQLVGISLNAGQSVYIDMEEGRVGDGLATAVRPFAVSGVFFPLRASGANNIQVEHTIGAGASLKFTTTWWPRYWTG